MKVVCCACDRVLKQGTGEPGERISHGYCPPCHDQALADINAYFAEMEKAAGVGSGQYASTPPRKERIYA